jgi:microcystin-dependent protein
MATVTGYTAERMKEIEDSTVVDGEVSGDDLILLTRDGTEINAGNVRGPQGIQGPSGNDISHIMELLSPVGHIASFGGDFAPEGWLLCNGASIVRENYIALYNVLGTKYGAADGAHFNVPNLQQRMPLGKGYAAPYTTLGHVGGSADTPVVAHSHPHAHTINADGYHGHTIAGDSGQRIIVTYWGANDIITPVAPGTGDVVPSHVDPGGSHAHGCSTDYTGAGGSGVNTNLPPFIVLNYIIRY